ncbi:MAG TPA: hypothetical protein PKD72_11940 [Gemmatales bacterium]|nr:hypothetical protein [Gemmatales bacterium]
MPSLIFHVAVYFGIVFGAGFLLGPLREQVLRPLVGARTAELIEMPVMLVIIVFAGYWMGRIMLENRRPGYRLLVGLLAATLVLLADVLVGVYLRGMTLRQIFLDRDQLTGLLYYSLVALFGLMPWRTAEK